MSSFLYRHFGEVDELLYVGITVNPRTRLPMHERAKDWYGRVRKITLTAYPDRASAMEAELVAIKTERPLFNVKMADMMPRNSNPFKPASGRLSQYERDILRLIIYGMDDGEIAKAIGLSRSTVQSRRRDILRKTGTHSSPKLISFGRKLFGLKEPELSADSFLPKQHFEAQSETEEFKLG